MVLILMGFLGLSLWFCAGVVQATSNHVFDAIPPQGKLVFWWTIAGKLQIGIKTYENKSNNWTEQDCGAPPLKTITDWRQYTVDKNNKRSDVMAGNIKKDSPWSFYSLSELPSVPWQIPDFIAVNPDLETLYTAVNLDLYLNINPWPSLHPGDHATISNGRLAGLEGIYWSSTEFTFDPDSENGFVGTPFTGEAYLQNFHDNIPLPPTVLLFGSGLLGLAGWRRFRKR